MTIYPNAKINLGLNVIAKRADGYHDLETVFYPISLCDELQITPREDKEIHLKTDGIVLDCEQEDNLIFRTCRMFQKEKKISGVDICFTKQIPFGAGLGGGSSDAAHTALVLNQLFNLNLSKGDLQLMVSQLGADCAFFVENNPCFAEGKGEILTPVNLDLSAYSLLLLKPASAVSTREAYSGIKPQQPKHSILEIIRRPVCEWKDFLTNDFEATVFPSHPEIKRIKQLLYKHGALYASMTGSGAAVYGIFEELPLTQIRQETPDCFVFSQTSL